MSTPYTVTLGREALRVHHSDLLAHYGLPEAHDKPLALRLVATVSASVMHGSGTCQPLLVNLKPRRVRGVSLWPRSSLTVKQAGTVGGTLSLFLNSRLSA